MMLLNIYDVPAGYELPIFSTEPYSENKTQDPIRLEIYTNRFVQGSGSLIHIETMIDPK
jgi:hypothetical protein